MDPVELLTGRVGSLSPWPERVESMMTAFALEAGMRERDVMTILEAFGEPDG